MAVEHVPSLRQRSRRYIVGAAGLGAVVVFVVGVGLDYSQALPWQHQPEVTLTTTAAGLELDPGADVKLEGVPIGTVRSVTSDGRMATLHLALDSDRLSLIPRNVDAAIVPKTLFGEKYVALSLPAHPDAVRIEAGNVISQSTTSVEIGKIYDDVLPILLTLNPVQLSDTLQAVSGALQGRGAQIGQTSAQLNTFLTGLDPHLTTLTTDLAELGKVTNEFNRDSPAFLQLLDSTSAISSELLVPQQKALDGFLTSATGAVQEATTIYRQDGPATVTLTGSSLPILRLLQQYSSEYPCLVQGLSLGNNIIDHALGGPGPFLQVTVDAPSTQTRSYTAPADLPSNPTSTANDNHLAKYVYSWAPHCLQIPAQALGVKDVAAYSYNDKTASRTSASGARTASANQAGLVTGDPASEHAIVTTLATQAGHPPGAGAGVLTLLLSPLLHAGLVVS